MKKNKQAQDKVSPKENLSNTNKSNTDLKDSNTQIKEGITYDSNTLKLYGITQEEAHEIVVKTFKISRFDFEKYKHEAENLGTNFSNYIKTILQANFDNPTSKTKKDEFYFLNKILENQNILLKNISKLAKDLNLETNNNLLLLENLIKIKNLQSELLKDEFLAKLLQAMKAKNSGKTKKA